MRQLKPLLFVPAHEERFILKARTMPDWCEVVLDLEDGCPKDKRELALANVERLAELGDWIRVGIEPELDAALAGRVGARGVVVPLATPDDATVWTLPAGLERMSTIENAVGLEYASQIASFSDALILGMGDLSVDLDSDEFESFAARRVVVAAKAYGAEVYAPPCLSTNNEERARAARGAYLLGFDGQAALHPDAATVVRNYGRPTEEEIRRAHYIVAQGEPRMLRDGENLLGPPHFRRARKILAEEE